jgi:hypothetical protein
MWALALIHTPRETDDERALGPAVNLAKKNIDP